VKQGSKGWTLLLTGTITYISCRALSFSLKAGPSSSLVYLSPPPSLDPPPHWYLQY
jgi:hypothetical protein